MTYAGQNGPRGQLATEPRGPEPRFEMNDTRKNHELESRTRPGRQPNPDVSALRALRRATDDYILILTAGYEALTNEAIAHSPELAYLRSAIGVAIGARSGSGYSFGTPVGIRNMLSRLLGEEATP